MPNPSDTPWPFPTADSHEPLVEAEKPVLIDPSEDALDSGVEESFPASDPVSVTVSKVMPKTDKDVAARNNTESASAKDS